MNKEKLNEITIKLKLAQFATDYIAFDLKNKEAVYDITDYIVEIENALAEYDADWKAYLESRGKNTTIVEGELEVNGQKMKGFHIDIPSNVKPEDMMEALQKMIGDLAKNAQPEERKSGYDEAKQSYQNEAVSTGEDKQVSEEAQKARTYPEYIRGRDATGRVRRYPTQ